MTTSDEYVKRTGVRLRTILNDLKRNDEAAADELDISLEKLRSYIDGEEEMPHGFVAKVAKVWPVNERDCYVIRDDAPSGVQIMRSAESCSSSRVFTRGGVEYYEYRDTAMSRLSSLRPEWIKMLVNVEDNDPYNPAVQWNDGHLLYQFTYFVGEVNYYYEWEGKKYCRPMETGDSVFGLPYAKHSFAARGPEGQGHILALTYGGRLAGDGEQELSALGEDLAVRYASASVAADEPQAALLQAYVSDGSYSTEHLAQAIGVTHDTLNGVLGGRQALNSQQLKALAAELQLDERELWALQSDTTNGVVILDRSDATSWFLPTSENAAYKLSRLACSQITPFARSLELEPLLPNSDESHLIETGLHQYCFNHGDTAIVFNWNSSGQSNQTVLEPGDSLYIKPFVSHWYSLPPGVDPNPDSKVLILRVGGKLTGDTRLEASIMGPESLARIISDTNPWYDQEISSDSAQETKSKVLQ